MVCTCVNELKRLQSGGSCTTLMTYSFVTQPASSTSCAHSARRLPYWRPRVTKGCPAGSQTTWKRFFLLPGRHSPLREHPRAEIWQANRRLQSVFPCRRSDRVCSSRSATQTIFSNGPFSAMPAPATARKGRLQTQEWRSDGRAEWDGAECTYYRRAGAMPAAVVAGDGCGFVHAVWELVLSLGPEYSHCPRHSDERRGHISESGGPSGGCKLPSQCTVRSWPRRRRSQLD